MQRGEVKTLAASVNNARERDARSAMLPKADGGRSSVAAFVCARAGVPASAAANAAPRRGVVRMGSGPMFRSDNARIGRTFRPTGQGRSAVGGLPGQVRSEPL